MDNMKEEFIRGLQSQYSTVTEKTLAYLKRDGWLASDPQMGDFIEGVKKCVQFARARKFTLGTARGSAPASLSLFGLGFSGVDPLKHEMIPLETR